MLYNKNINEWLDIRFLSQMYWFGISIINFTSSRSFEEIPNFLYEKPLRWRSNIENIYSSLKYSCILYICICLMVKKSTLIWRKIRKDSKYLPFFYYFIYLLDECCCRLQPIIIWNSLPQFVLILFWGSRIHIRSKWKNTHTHMHKNQHNFRLLFFLLYLFHFMVL